MNHPPFTTRLHDRHLIALTRRVSDGYSAAVHSYQFHVVDGPLRGETLELPMGPGSAGLVVDLTDRDGHLVPYTARPAPYRSDKWLDPYGLGTYGGPFGLWEAEQSTPGA